MNKQVLSFLCSRLPFDGFNKYGYDQQKSRSTSGIFYASYVPKPIGLMLLQLFLLVQYHINGSGKQGVFLFHKIGNGTYHLFYLVLWQAGFCGYCSDKVLHIRVL